ncbi:YtxH domain-containing protein [Gracilimonas sp. Q87]|uniref:YtxH domain-containing protein n=1 Tax=Gracilimonas sp. Q87 TaxID=3384766 RepID=UPI003984323B
MKRGIGTLLVGATAFAGGVLTGLLLTPRSGKENLKWVKDQSEETVEWLETTGRKIREDGEKRIDRFSEGIKKTMKDSLPDLYEATEDLEFSEDEEIEEITKNG